MSIAEMICFQNYEVEPYFSILILW